jgi:hypothetical protein
MHLRPLPAAGTTEAADAGAGLHRLVVRVVESITRSQLGPEAESATNRRAGGRC